MNCKMKLPWAEFVVSTDLAIAQCLPDEFSNNYKIVYILELPFEQVW